MRVDPRATRPVARDDWLEAQCRAIEDAGKEMAQIVGQINARTAQSNNGELGRRKRITESQVRALEEAVQTLHEIQRSIQNALFDCEHELRELRERDVDPAELLIDGERLIRQYRFLRRRARIIDALLAYLPAAEGYAAGCLDRLKALKDGGELAEPLKVPDCGFALVALDQLRAV
jgi:prefoldin subunit 5